MRFWLVEPLVFLVRLILEGGVPLSAERQLLLGRHFLAAVAAARQTLTELERALMEAAQYSAQPVAVVVAVLREPRPAPLNSAALEALLVALLQMQAAVLHLPQSTQEPSQATALTVTQQNVAAEALAVPQIMLAQVPQVVMVASPEAEAEAAAAALQQVAQVVPVLLVV